MQNFLMVLLALGFSLNAQADADYRNIGKCREALGLPVSSGYAYTRKDFKAAGIHKLNFRNKEWNISALLGLGLKSFIAVGSGESGKLVAVEPGQKSITYVNGNQICTTQVKSGNINVFRLDWETISRADRDPATCVPIDRTKLRETDQIKGPNGEQLSEAIPISAKQMTALLRTRARALFSEARVAKYEKEATEAAVGWAKISKAKAEERREQMNSLPERAMKDLWNDRTKALFKECERAEKMTTSCEALMTGKAALEAETLKRAQLARDEWNEKHPPGSDRSFKHILEIYEFRRDNAKACAELADPTLKKFGELKIAAENRILAAVRQVSNQQAEDGSGDFSDTDGTGHSAQ